MKNYQLVMTTVLDTGLIITVYRTRPQQGDGSDRFNLQMMFDTGDIMLRRENITLNEALEVCNGQIACDLDS